jgi:hypothetical protein
MLAQRYAVVCVKLGRDAALAATGGTIVRAGVCEQCRRLASRHALAVAQEGSAPPASTSVMATYAAEQMNACRGLLRLYRRCLGSHRDISAEKSLRFC